MATTKVAGVSVSTDHFIDGKRVESKRKFANCSPIDGKHLADMSAGGAEEIDAAVAAARRAYPKWAALGPEGRHPVLKRFAQAIQMQDKAALLELVSEGANWTSDGGGETRAALKVIRGRERVVRFALGVLGRHMDRFAFEMTFVNGEPALAMRAEGRLLSIITVLTDGTRILDVYTVLNPNKLKVPAAAVHG